MGEPSVRTASGRHAIGEFWMIAYLLFRGINQSAVTMRTEGGSAPEAATAT